MGNTTIVVEAEEIFVEFLESFSPEANAILFTDTLAGARSECKLRSPKLLVLVLRGREQELECINIAKEKGGSVIGLTTGEASEAAQAKADQLIPREHLVQVVKAAQEILGVEDNQPRRASDVLKLALATMKPPGSDKQEPEVATEEPTPDAPPEKDKKKEEEKQDRESAPATEEMSPLPNPDKVDKGDPQELERLAKRVESLAAELERTRKELATRLEKRGKPDLGVKNQIDELVWDLGEMRQEAEDARDTLKKRLDAQDEQIKGLRKQLAEIVAGAQDGRQAVGRTALVDSLKEESTEPRVPGPSELKLETPGPLLAPDFAPLGAPLEEDEDTDSFHDDAVTAQVDIDVQKLLDGPIPAPPDLAEIGVEDEDDETVKADLNLVLPPDAIADCGGTGSLRTNTPVTVSVTQPFIPEDDTVVDPNAGTAEEPAAADEAAADAVFIPDSEGGPGPARFVPTMEVERPEGLDDDDKPRSVPRFMVVLTGLALLALVGSVIFYFISSGSDAQSPPPPPPEPEPAVVRPPPTPDLRIPDTAPLDPDAMTAVDATVTSEEPDAPPAKTEKPLSPAAKRAALRRRKRQLWAGYLRVAKRAIRGNQQAEARKALNRALKIKDGYRVRVLMAQSHHRAGELWPAVHHLEKALATAPGRARSRLHDQLGLIFIKLGKKSRACKSFRAAASGATTRHLEKHCK